MDRGFRAFRLMAGAPTSGITFVHFLSAQRRVQIELHGEGFMAGRHPSGNFAVASAGKLHKMPTPRSVGDESAAGRARTFTLGRPGGQTAGATRNSSRARRFPQHRKPGQPAKTGRSVLNPAETAGKRTRISRSADPISPTPDASTNLENSGRVPNRRGPGAFLYGTHMGLAAAALETRRDRRWIIARNLRVYANLLTPATRRILEHPGVIESALLGIEVGIHPDRAE